MSSSLSQIVPVIMSGGAGSRLWPASTSSAPKQLLPLISDQTMLQETAGRLRGTFGEFEFTAPLVICGRDHIDIIAQQLADIGLPGARIIAEPAGRNTAPCAAAAAILAREYGDDALMLLAPADHHIARPADFMRAIGQACPAARDDFLVTFGITPTRPETGYGYIEFGEELVGSVSRVASFKEKPGADTAAHYIASGNYAWNAGIFLMRPSALLSEMDLYCPEIRRHAETAALSLNGQARGVLPDEFLRCPSESIDYAVMEHTDKAAIMPADMGWNDIGAWSALWEMKKDAGGIAARGPVHIIGSSNCLVDSDGAFTAVIGAQNLAVIVREGAVLVANMDDVQKVKDVVTHLKSEERLDLL